MHKRFGIGLSLLVACGAPPSVPQSAAAPPPSTPPPAAKAVEPPIAPVPYDVNRGGMWPPEQIQTQAEQLRQLGLAIDPALLADPASPLLGAVLNLGGCSASFVSPDGLIATNHHCAVRSLEYNSQPQKNLMETGFLANARAEEPFAGPAARALLTLAIRDVTLEVRAALSKAKDDLAREAAYETEQKELVQRCEQARPNTRCQLVSFYDGLKYALFERLELRDVRIVYAPPDGVGNFGGEIDNWRWPRHSGDVAFFRAYVDASGKPAAYAAENQPYRPAHYLKVAQTPLRPHDLVLVTGFPGRTARLKTRYEVEDVTNWLYPRRLRQFDEYLAMFEKVAASDPNAKIKASSWVRGFSNYRTKHKGELEGMLRVGLLEKKKAEEQSLEKAIRASPELTSKYANVLEAIRAAFAEYEKTREADVELENEISMPRLVSAANRIVRMAEERAKPDAERDPDYQQRNWHLLTDELAALDKLYYRPLDEAVLRLALERSLRTSAAERSPALALIAGKQPTPESIEKAVGRLYQTTELADAKVRQQLFERATSAELRAHKDPLLKLAVTLRPLLRAAETRRKRLSGKLLDLKPKYMEALLSVLGPNVPPDANGTLRISYGLVREPYVDDPATVQNPAPGIAPEWSAFTTLSGVVKKNRSAPPFAAPPRLLEAARERRFGRYAVPALADVPVDFLSDANISNGNSGSATLNARGELAGLAFDGTYESVAADWAVLPNTRSIHVDIRYVLWLLDEVEHASALLAELGVPARSR
ncbi:MAG: S46 family peptidase [Myxococcota bacterium]